MPTQQPGELTPKQKRFALEYTIDHNGTQAAIRAGYSANGADVQAVRLLANASVQAAIQRDSEKTARKLEITRERIVAEYAKLAFSDMRKFAKWDASGVELMDSESLEDGDAACVAELGQTVTEHGGSIRFKLHDKKGALDSLAKLLGFDAEPDGEDDPLSKLLAQANSEAKRATAQ